MPTLWEVAWRPVLFYAALAVVVTASLTNGYHPLAWAGLAVAVALVATEPLHRRRLYRKYPHWAPPTRRRR